jgi:methyl-accepting chemotaxis protein
MGQIRAAENPDHALVGMVESGETGAAAEQVLGVAGELSEQAELLRGRVETFLAGIKAA